MNNNCGDDHRDDDAGNCESNEDRDDGFHSNDLIIIGMMMMVILTR